MNYAVVNLIGRVTGLERNHMSKKKILQGTSESGLEKEKSSGNGLRERKTESN